MSAAARDGESRGSGARETNTYSKDKRAAKAWSEFTIMGQLTRLMINLNDPIFFIRFFIDSEEIFAYTTRLGSVLLKNSAQIVRARPRAASGGKASP